MEGAEACEEEVMALADEHHEDKGAAPALGRAGSKWVQEEVRGLGLAIKKNALAALLELEGGEEAVLGVLDVLQARQMTSTVITRSDVEGALLQRAASAGAGAGAAADAGRKVGLPRPAVVYGSDEFMVLNAFDAPRFCWDIIRKSFYMDHSPRSILGKPESKVHMYKNRFHMLLQRLERDRLFKRPALEFCSSREYCELTPLQSLIGLVGVTKFVVGALNQLEDGRYFLEDTSTNVPVDLSGTMTATGMFTEGCVVVAEGSLRVDGVFEVFALGFPPSEPKKVSLQAAPGIDFFGGGQINAEDLPGLRAVEEASDIGALVVLSEVHLNKPTTIERLRTLFSGYEETGSVPAMFVLMGNFTSVGNDGSGISSTLVELKRGFENLAKLLSEFTLTRTQSQFVIVPGPGDVCPSQALPRPAFVDYFADDLKKSVPNVVMASSPCRIRYHSQFIVLHRDNMLEKMRRSIVVPCDGDDEVTHFQQLTVTILQQSHLSPLPNNVQPTYWEYDHALSVYPMPELLVLGDVCSQQHHTFEGVESVNPGSFTLDGSFLVYEPQTRTVDLSGVDLPAL